jgi:GTP:adenosylcobinamide-phosphate guanylyltransferase
VKRIGEEEIDRVDPERLSFFNVNTNQDLKKAQAILPRVTDSGQQP